jgi:hypothetical protein
LYTPEPLLPSVGPAKMKPQIEGGLPVRYPVAVATLISAALLGASPSWGQGETSNVVIAPTTPVVTAATPPWMDAWLGFGATDTFRGVGVGGVAALNRNLWVDGFVVRGEAQLGQYDATSVTTDDVWTHGASLMLGYRAKVGQGFVTGYVGANYETHENDDRSAAIRGTEVGFRALLEYYTQLTPYVDFYGMASYSTAFDTAFLFGRVGFKVVDNVWVGPEALYFRDDAPYREQRVGAFVRFDQTFTGGGISLSGGFLNPLSTPDDGWYASLGLSWSLR